MTFPTSTNAGGIWTLRDALRYKAAGQWPRGPAAPTSLAGTPGDQQVALSWTAPATAHGTITDYVVEYTAAGDPFFNSVSLLAPLDADTTSVVGGLTPTVSGTAMTISPSGGKFGGYATNTVSTSTTTYTASFGNGDWTVECWIQRDSLFSTNPRIIDLGAVELEPGTNQTINFYYRPTDVNFSSSTFLTTQGQWHHIAIVYQGGVLRSYVDGIQRGSLTQSVTPPTSVQLTNTCSFDDLRVTAAAVYPDGTTFTPPTSAHATSGTGSPTVVAAGSTAASYTLTGLTNDTEYTIRVAGVNHTGGDWSDSVAVTPSGAPADPDFASVALLLHFDGDITDSSSYAQTMTAPWGASFDAANYKFGTHSLSGNGSHVKRDSFPAGNPLLIGSNPFTIEFWLYFAGYFQSPSTLVYSNNSNFKLELANYGSYRSLMSYFGGFWLQYNTDQPVPLNEWSHVVAVGYGAGGGAALYVNGSRVAFSANTYNFGSDPIGPVGLYGSHNASNRFDEFRFTNGVARYSGETIVVPTAAFPDY